MLHRSSSGREELVWGMGRFIPAGNEPSGRACTASWRMPRGSNTKVSEGHFLLCSVASLIMAAGSSEDWTDRDDGEWM